MDCYSTLRNKFLQFLVRKGLVFRQLVCKLGWSYYFWGIIVPRVYYDQQEIVPYAFEHVENSLSHCTKVPILVSVC